jgi:PPOX class probable FMN-dependent enzyme
MAFASTVRSIGELRDLYQPPSRPAIAKQLDRLDAHCQALIDRSSFLVLATSDADGHCDASPRGGPPGFVKVLDEHRLCLPDLSGNNRLDSLENLLEHPGVGLLFFVPGLDETLRVNGDAVITTDPEVLDACAIGDLRPRVALGVDVREAFIHCAKALRRGSLWRHDQWPDRTGLPTVACMLRDHYDLPELDVAAVERRLASSYSSTMWLAGGNTPALHGD